MLRLLSVNMTVLRELLETPESIEHDRFCQEAYDLVVPLFADRTILHPGLAQSEQ